MIGPARPRSQISLTDMSFVYVHGLHQMLGLDLGGYCFEILKMDQRGVGRAWDCIPKHFRRIELGMLLLLLYKVCWLMRGWGQN